ncbi:hypothetical protein GOBAR_AA01824 [Gossypium barbadense]|uniref:C2H2-type domain-containing protein n=1 Tax=Gossypium barbadense TaxID=3634 RepID=A0A2P5YT47_GOSBA|nr:hypothetical protein GOBAR_AA01824 [Gossypium barbadense]
MQKNEVLGSLCSNTKVIHCRPEMASPEVHKKRASFGSFDTSSRSMKAPLRELNGVAVSSTNSSSLLSVSSAAAASSSAGGSFGGMPFRRFSGCYECKLVVDPLLGISKDPSLRGTICSCPECGEIFMKAENLELHQAVRHAIIKNGFKVAQETNGKGILTTATSGKAHDKAAGVEDGDYEKRAMLVCRVIAGRVKKNIMEGDNLEEYDSVAGAVGVYSDLDELFVFNPNAILPCFVVIYRGF